MEAIIDLLNVKDAEQLEYAFTTLAYLFKFLRQYMIKNVGGIFKLLLPLLEDTKPAYINDFAAESFAYVVRHVKDGDKSNFLKLVLESLEDSHGGVVGCGKLLFRVLAGVTGQFNSHAEHMLGIYLDVFQDTSVNQDLLFEVLNVIFKCITKEIHYQKCDVLWNVIFKYLDKFTDTLLILLLQLIQIIINHKEGCMLKDPVLWSKKLANLIDNYPENDKVLEEISNAAVATLLAPSAKLLQETTSFLIRKLLSIDNKELLLEITEKLLPHSSFETSIIPEILKKSNFASLDEKVLDLLVKTINYKSPPALNGIDFSKWTKYCLNICSEKNFSYLSDLLDSLQKEEIKENALKILIVLPHFPKLNEELFTKLVQSFISLYKQAQNISKHQARINFAFLLVTHCIVKCCKADPDKFHKLLQELCISASKLALTALKHENDVAMLNALDLCLSHLKDSNYVDEYINMNVFDQIHQSFSCKLGKHTFIF